MSRRAAFSHVARVIVANAAVAVSAAAALLMLAACTAPSQRGGRDQGGEPATEPNNGAVDASYDWHGLVIAPFGTLLKEMPFALHEVLLFHDESPGGAAALDGPDCQGIDGAPPRFVGHQLDQYLLCFEHDRLARIEVSVRLPRDTAAQVLARACAVWMKGQAARPTDANTCEGRDESVVFSARLDAPAGPTVPLSVTLSKESVSGARRDAVATSPREK